MADPSPTDAEPEGQEPQAGEGQEPNGEPAAEGQEPSGRNYSEAYVKQLRREASGHRTRVSELEAQLQEHTDRDKSELEKLTERLTAAERRAEDSGLALLRYQVAAEHGLDLKAAGFLGGTTREEIELRAEELTQLLTETAGQRPTGTAGFDGGARATVPDTRS